MHPKHLRHLTYAISFFVTLHVALVTYTNSTALARVVAEDRVPFVYTAGFALALVLLIAVPRLLKGIGDVRATLFFLLLEIIALIGLAVFGTSTLFVFFFILHLVIPQLLILDIDVFLEHATQDKTTGSTRGAYLTILNTGFVIAPLIIGFILGDGNAYENVYMLSALVLLPAFLIVLISFSHFKDPVYRRLNPLPAFRSVLAQPALRGIFISNFLLRSFYAVMVIFMPLYLHTELLISWKIIGILFTIMLLPFVLFEYPLGRLADTRFGEKEILALGFFFLAFATAVIPFIPGSALALLATTLFLTRVGASAVEIMNDTYFFKHIHESDTETIALFRMFEPFAYIVAPLVTGVVLSFIDIRFIFLVLGLSMAVGIITALRLKDTR